MHVRDGKLRAFIDSELSQNEARRLEAHLSTCARCRKRFMRMRSEMDALDEPLRRLAAGQSQRSHASRALARLQTQIETNGRPLSGGITLRNNGLSRNWQRTLGGLAAVAIVAVLLSFAPVRAAASELLAVFRLENIVILPVSLEDVERLDSATSELGDDFFPGDMEVLTEPGEPKFLESLASASDAAGFTVRSPGTFPAPDEIVVRDGMTSRFEPDVEAMQELFEAADLSPDLVPEEIDGQAFEFNMSASVAQIWTGDNSDPLMVMQSPAPEVTFPDEIDEEALGVAMLQLLGLSAEEAAAVSGSIDWSSTLLLPLPTDFVEFEPVIVDGAEGFLLTGESPDEDIELTYNALLWQKNGIVTLVGGSADAESMLEIANSMQ